MRLFSPSWLAYIAILAGATILAKKGCNGFIVPPQVQITTGSHSREGRIVMMVGWFKGPTTGGMGKSAAPASQILAPPFANLAQNKLDYAAILQQAASSVTASIQAGQRTVTIDYPPDEGSTLVKRYETDRSFALALIKALGCKSYSQVGTDVEIRNNIAPNGGGEYLTEEDLSGFVGLNGPGGKKLSVILNPGIDSSNLRSLKALDDTRGNVVLLNCGVERMTFFDKVGMGDYLDGFKPAYSLQRAGTGFIFRAYPSPWQLHVVTNGKMSLIESSDKRPSFVDASKRIKAYL